ncbi:hypothetical protein GTY54_29380, partial [Streptomyces sp. SID625]|nr:hypothetical protein [Streptomyces sp. SID625]
MNYCHPCRRHLNGALACPGCGTPAETAPVSAREPEPPPRSHELAHGHGYGYEPAADAGSTGSAGNTERAGGAADGDDIVAADTRTAEHTDTRTAERDPSAGREP